jgi:hypothetical protein
MEYCTPQEAQDADMGMHARELARVQYELGCIFEEKRLLYALIQVQDDEDELEELRWRLKAQQDLEKTITRRGSMLQSLLKVP